MSVNTKSTKEKVMKIYQDSWVAEKSQKPKLFNYLCIENELGVARHLKVNVSKFKRSLISQFRFGVLSLEVEVGRCHRNPM